MPCTTTSSPPTRPPRAAQTPSQAGANRCDRLRRRARPRGSRPRRGHVVRLACAAAREERARERRPRSSGRPAAQPRRRQRPRGRCDRDVDALRGLPARWWQLQRDRHGRRARSRRHLRDRRGVRLAGSAADGCPSDAGAGPQTPVVVGGRLASKDATTLDVRYPDGSAEQVHMGDDRFFLFDVPAGQLTSVHAGGLTLVALDQTGAVVARQQLPADWDDPAVSDEQAPIYVSTRSDESDLTKVYGLEGHVGAAGAATLELDYGDGATVAIPLQQDGGYEYTVPPQRVGDFMTPRTLVVRRRTRPGGRWCVRRGRRVLAGERTGRAVKPVRRAQLQPSRDRRRGRRRCPARVRRCERRLWPWAGSRSSRRKHRLRPRRPVRLLGPPRRSHEVAGVLRRRRRVLHVQHVRAGKHVVRPGREQRRQPRAHARHLRSHRPAQPVPRLVRGRDPVVHR